MPATKKIIHFIGIGGIGVSALARYYLARGHMVTGSDFTSSEITESLKKDGAKISIGKNIIPKNADLIIYSPAVKIAKTKIPTLSYPEALGQLTKEYFTIAVSGTHGKTTTTAMLALILIKAGLDPTVIIGTKLKEFNNTNFRIGKSRYLLIEADEHFASFLNYWPQILAITNIEADHLDFYKNLKNIKKAFNKFIGHLPKDGILITGKSTDKKDFLEVRKILGVPGNHNVYDALVALATARALKIPDKISLTALAGYKGAWRRFEIIKQKPFILISDYGHNPQKALAALKAGREKYPNKKIWCVYQPHQYERTYFLFNDFVKVFKKAPIDRLIITDIFDVAGRESSEIRQKVDSQKLVKAINKNSVSYLPKNKIVAYLKKEVKSGEVVIIMGAGDIYLIDKEL
ncbi:MAG: Mur ligase domain-containing protein [Candidatus Nealsonbacteria bacterium]